MAPRNLSNELSWLVMMNQDRWWPSQPYLVPSIDSMYHRAVAVSDTKLPIVILITSSLFLETFCCHVENLRICAVCIWACCGDGHFVVGLSGFNCPRNAHLEVLVCIYGKRVNLGWCLILVSWFHDKYLAMGYYYWFYFLIQPPFYRRYIECDWWGRIWGAHVT